MVAAALLVAWTFLAGSCAGILAMSGAESTSGDWPVGATVALVLVACVWIIVPIFVWARQRAAPGPGVEASPLRRRLATAPKRPPPPLTHSGPGRTTRDDSSIQRGRLNPEHRHFGPVTPRPTTNATPTPPGSPRRAPTRPLDNKEASIRAGVAAGKQCPPAPQPALPRAPGGVLSGEAPNRTPVHGLWAAPLLLTLERGTKMVPTSREERHPGDRGGGLRCSCPPSD